MNKLKRGLGASLIVAGLVAGASAQVLPAFATSPVTAKIYAGQAYDVSRVPAYPTCTSSTAADPFTVTVTGLPFSYWSLAGQDRARREIPVGYYVKAALSGDATNPIKLVMYNQADQEVHWDNVNSAWVDSTDPNFANFYNYQQKGKVYALYADGYFFVNERGNGTFISLVDQHVNGDVITYTPDMSLNKCTGNQPIAKLSAFGAPAESTPGLANTGTDTAFQLWAAFGLLALGGGLLVSKRR